MRAGYANPRKRTLRQGPVVRPKATESRRNGDKVEKREIVEEHAMETTSDPDALLTPSEVAAMFRVNPKTVTRWARAGKISAIRTLGGHRRFRAAEIRRVLEQVEEGAETP